MSADYDAEVQKSARALSEIAWTLESASDPDTRIERTAEQLRRAANGHDATGAPAPDWHWPVLEGAGALHSTAEDLLAYLHAHLALRPPELHDALAEAVAGIGTSWTMWREKSLNDLTTKAARLARLTARDGQQRALDHAAGSLGELQDLRLAVRNRWLLLRDHFPTRIAVVGIGQLHLKAAALAVLLREGVWQAPQDG